MDPAGGALVVRLAALVEVEIAAIAVHRLVGGAQVMGIGERVLGLAREVASRNTFVRRYPDQ